MKAHFTPFQFYEVPTLVLVFTNQKKSEEDFDIYEKKVKKKINLQCLFCSEQHKGRVYSE